MKFISVFFLLLSAFSAQASQSYLCFDPTVMDSTYTATFTNLVGTSAQVDLFVPTGETSGTVYSGKCKADEGADELAYTCQVHSPGSHYIVKIFSYGGPELFASVKNKKGETTFACNEI